MAQMKITEKEILSSLLDTAHVLVTQTIAQEDGTAVESLRRVPLDVFWAELYDARKDNPNKDGTDNIYGSIGEFLRAMSEKLAKADFDMDFSNLDLKLNSEDGLLYIYDTKNEKYLGDGWQPTGGGGGSVTGSILKLINTTGSTSVAVATGHDCAISFKWSSVDDADRTETGQGSAAYTLNGEQIAVNAVDQGELTYTIPGSVIKDGNNSFTVTLTDAYGASKSLTWTITAKSISLSCDLDDGLINSGSLLIRYTPIGSNMAKTTVFELDGEEIGTASTTDTNIAKSFTIPTQNHGSHVLRIWTYATVGGVEIRSAVLVYHLVWIDETNTDPIISVKEYTVPKQYTTTNIPYTVYDPASLQAEITLSVDNVEVGSLTVDRSLQTWQYKPTTTGLHKLTITCRNASVTLELNVEGSGVTASEITSGLLWKFDPAGRSNAEAERDQWSDGDVYMTVSEGFHWTVGGWGTDEDGIPCFTVPAGDTITISATPFATDWKQNGHLLKMIFKCVNVRNYDAEFINCYSGDIGFKVQAQTAIIKSVNRTLSLPLCEEKYTELEFNVTSTAQHREVVGWLQGIPSGVKVYPTTDSWVQSSPAPIIIGSPDCDVRIYKMREYETFLTDPEMFYNWIADAPSGEEMLDRWLRNQITDDNDGITIDPDKLAEICPDLRVITLTCPRFTTGKEDTVSGCTVRHVWKGGGSKHCWTASNVDHKGQGTTSDKYGDSGRNVDTEYHSGFDLDDGTHIDTYAMTSNSIGVDYFNLKVNVASSENCNNAILTDEYQIFNPYLRAARQADSRVRDTMEFHPCALFVRDLSGELFGDTDVHFYAAGDFGNSKKNYAAQGLTGTNPIECIVELLNNDDAQTRWKSDDLTSEAWDGEGSVEFRYPKNPTDDMKAAFQRVLSWVVSTDPEQATDENLPEAVTYDSVVYYTDSADYRRAKFRAEFDDYFISDSVTFYYLFTERHTMVDNRAKNSFWHTEDGIHWDLCFDYDNDTAMGNDNMGELTLTYGMEDTDTIGTKSVFNAADSVIFCNVRDCLPDRLAAMFQQMESAGCCSAKRLLAKAEAYQKVKPERLWVADMRRKYLRPYEDSGITSYLEMLHGPKILQRAQFETYQERYCASKYVSAVCTEDVLTVRAFTPENYGPVEPNGTMKITMYIDCYIVVQHGSHVVKQRVKRGVPTEISSPNEEIEMNGKEIYIFDGSLVQEIDDLGALYVGYTNFGAAKKLQKLILSSYVLGYANTNINSLDVSNCTLLKVLEVCGCPNLTAPMDFTTIRTLDTVDLRGSGVSSVVFADGGTLVTAKLPAALTSVKCLSLYDLTTMTVESYTNLRTVQIEYCSTVNLADIINKATGITRVRLLDVDLALTNAEGLVRLTKAGGIDDNGYDVADPIITGEAYIGTLSQSKLDAIHAAFPNLVVTYGTIAPEYTVRFLMDDGTTVLESQTVEHGYAAEDPSTRKVNPIKPSKENQTYVAYVHSGWSVPFTNITGNLDVLATFVEIVRTYTVQWLNGNKVEQSSVVEAGTTAKYVGPELSEAGRFWMGWDIETTNVISDLIVHAVWEDPILPAEKVETAGYDFVYSDDPADRKAYSFGQFIAIINAGLASEYFNLYDKIKLVNSDPTLITDTDIVVSLHSFGYFELADNSGENAKTTWFGVGLLNAMRPMNSGNVNAGGYLSSDLDKWLEGTLYPRLKPHWRAVIKPVYFLANAGNQTYDITQKPRHMYIPTLSMVGINTTVAPYSDEIPPNANEEFFSMYTSNAQRIKKLNNGAGAAKEYWTASAQVGSSSQFCSIINYGGGNNTYNASYSNGVCVGLSI